MKHKRAVIVQRKLVPVVLVFGLLLLIYPYLHSQDTQDAGFKYLRNYSYREYDHQPQNWGLAQAPNGLIYVANNAGVLEYDGVSWRIIGVPDYKIVRSLAIDPTGTVYIGGKGDIGYLAPDAKGSLQYASLLDRLEGEQKNFSNVWRTHVTIEGIYFVSSEYLFRWHPESKRMKVWQSGQRFLYSFIARGKLYIHQAKTGLMQLNGDSLEMLPGTEIFADEKERIIMVVPYFPYSPYNIDIDPPRLLIGTLLKGFYLYDSLLETARPFPTEADDYLIKSEASHGICLSSGDFAVATRFGGLVVMDPRGRLKNIFNKTYGLQDENIKYVFEDKQGNLWLCLEKGITKIEYPSPISIHDERSNLSGLAAVVLKHHNDLYVGATNGLYYLESPLKFRLVPGITSNCWSLLSSENTILAATSGGVFSIDKNIPQKIIDSPSYILLPSRHSPGRTWCGTSKGLVTLSPKNGRWTQDLRFENIPHDIRNIVEENDGSLWLGTSAGSVLKVDFPGAGLSPIVTGYEKSHGLPGTEIYMAWAAGHVIFATEKGIFRFDENAKRFIPDRTLGDEFAAGPNSRPVFRLVEDNNNNIWFHSASRNYRAIPGHEGTFTIDAAPLLRIPTAQVNAIYPEPNGKVIWFASIDGLIRYDTTVKKNYRQDFQTLVRKVLTNDKLIFDGFKVKIDKADKDYFTIIEYKDRNLLHFEFAALFFEAEAETQYRCFLEGYDKDWYTLNKEAKKDYTNLDSGRYTFRVQARNVYEHEGEKDSFRFKIKLPWYRTWWAFLSYAVVFFLLTYLINRWWRSIKLEHEKQKLEQIVIERTKEVNNKNRLLEDQTLQLKDQSEKLKEMDKIKSRFFANISHEFRTPLTLIMSPLEQMLSDAGDKKQKEKYKVMLRGSQQLLTLINQLLDLSRFDSGKMKLQAACRDIVSFLKGIMGSFQVLAQQNRLTLEFYSASGEIPLYYDAQRMEEVMYNLLINAFKFTPAGGVIKVSVIKEQEVVKISVADTGTGIPKEQLPNIFDRFYQSEVPGGKGPRGTGIGLALTREIIQMHHGKIDVHSQEGKGSEFDIVLPLGDNHLNPDEIAAPSEIVPGPRRTKEIEAFFPAEEIPEPEEGEESKTCGEIGKEKETGPGEEPDQEKVVILVVEDNPDVRKYIREPLEPFYKVVEAGDGKEGIAKAKEIIPDLIVSDIMMPEADGYELCRELKKDIATSHIPIILLTAKASEESIIQGLETGADDYVTKPFNSRILFSRIKNLIELRRQMQLKIQRQKMLLPSEITVSSMDEKFLKELQGIVEKNMSDEEFDVDKLCGKLYMGRSTLFRKVKALTGETPNQFIMSYRLERGAQLLRENFGNVTEVAFAVGFSSSTYFATCFKEKFGQAPSSYQAEHSNI
ncbi:MAG: response regulator [Candidatus Aminicenantes bacterium]|nr:response regulator [Candidatus Aminicenantes bacterium]